MHSGTDQRSLLALFNPDATAAHFTLPDLGGAGWRLLIDSGTPAIEPDWEPVTAGRSMLVAERAVVLMETVEVPVWGRAEGEPQGAGAGSARSARST
jgi:hypothetical protein